MMMILMACPHCEWLAVSPEGNSRGRCVGRRTAALRIDEKPASGAVSFSVSLHKLGLRKNRKGGPERKVKENGVSHTIPPSIIHGVHLMAEPPKQRTTRKPQPLQRNRTAQTHCRALMRVRRTKVTAQRFPEFHVGTYCQISRGEKDVRGESRIESKIHRYFLRSGSPY